MKPKFIRIKYQRYSIKFASIDRYFFNTLNEYVMNNEYY